MVKSATRKEVSGSQQPMISTYFSQKPSPTKQRKRSNSPIDLTLDNLDDHDDAPPKKRTRTNGHLQSPIDSPPGIGKAGPSLKQHTGQAEQWRFVPTSPESPRPEKNIYTAAEEMTRKKNHEAFKKKLLEENSLFIRKKPSREGSESAMDVDHNPELHEYKAGDTDGSGSDSDPAFTTLHKQFSNKSKDRGKGKAPLIRKQKVEDVGPSGQTWTPLEKQVSRVHTLFFLYFFLMLSRF